MRLINAGFLASTLISAAAAMGPDVRSETCYEAAGSFMYSDLEMENYDWCASNILTGTVALCINEYYPKSAQKVWKDYLNSYYCTAEVDNPPDYEATLANATLYVGEAPIGMNVTTTPFIIDSALLGEWYQTNYAYYDNIYLGQEYGWIIVVLGCGIMSLAGLLRLLRHYSKYLQTTSPAPLKFVQRHLTIPALFNQSHVARPSFLGMEFSIPTRLESIFLFAFIVVNVVMDFVAFDIFSGNFYWAETIDQFQRYVADRSAMLSIAQFPFLFAFAGRNTIFLWITGWSYESFSVFHKWIGRVSVYHALVHTIAYTISFYRAGGYAYMKLYYEDAYLQWGAAAMVAGFLLVTGALYGIRKRWYETFLISHILMAVVWLVGTFYHIKLLDEPQYLKWLWAAIAFWAFDRGVRLLRLVYINDLSLFGAGGRGLAEIIVLQEDVLRLEVPVPARWKSSPGQYAFVYFPSFKFFQSHPFTIVDVIESSSASNVDVALSKGSAEIHTTEVDEVKTSYQKRVVFVLKAHKGVTQQLLKAAVMNGGRLHTRALLEGPYGETHDLDNFDKVTIIAGGLGITACVPFLMKLAQNKSSRHQEVVLHWAIREERALDWFSEDFSKALARQTTNKIIRVSIHVTGAADKPDSDSYEEKTGAKAPDMLITYGRPSMRALISNEIEGGKIDSTHVVLSCGPGTLSDDCRAGVVAALGQAGKKSIRYFEESFTW